MDDHPDSGYVPALRFRWLTPAYDVVVRATTRERTVKAALIAQARIAASQCVLDLACGTGTLAIWVKQHCPQATVVGIDGDKAILAIASRKARVANASVQFDHGLSYRLPYTDGRFDRIVSSLFFHHLSWKDKQRTARELFRVLRPGGELHVADWGRATGPLMRAGFVAVQLLDGFRNTKDNVDGRLIDLFQAADFSGVAQTSQFSTAFGTLALYRAEKRS
ncbi:MAG: class I SAM-dependent methyltransferase [Gammaproteobacteria bacterium]|nr:class I SAM-dependent methyltransferase [Gammaproteobacteria bacterium]